MGASLPADNAAATSAVQAIRSGDTDSLQRLLQDYPGLSNTRVDGQRTLLHVATDWPGHFPNNSATVTVLIAAGAGVNTPFLGEHSETPLHWAASCNDVDVLDTLLEHGADIEAPGAVIGGGTPLADAVAFGQWEAARRLVERGAATTMWQAAALGMMDRVRPYFAAEPPPLPEITNAFWCACFGGQQLAAEYLLAHGADFNWTGHDGLTPLDAASTGGAEPLVAWLQGIGAKSAADLR